MRTFSLEQSILATLAYFDQFDYPLTSFELWEHLLMPDRSDYAFADVLIALECSPLLCQKLESCEGFYFLCGRRVIVEMRKERVIISEFKFRKAVAMIRLIAMMPFVRMVGVCGGIALDNAKREGDIDLFIVAQKDFIWVARSFCVALAAFLRVRPTKELRRDKICLSFFTTEASLNLSPLIMDECEGLPDVHFMEWATSMRPVYDEGGVYDRLWGENMVVRNVFPNVLGSVSHSRRLVTLAWWSRSIKGLLEWLVIMTGRLGRDWIKQHQLRIMPAGLRDIANIDSRVVVNDHYLKLHVNDRRLAYRDGFALRLGSLIEEGV